MVDRIQCARCPTVHDETLLTYCRGVDEYLCEECIIGAVAEAFNLCEKCDAAPITDDDTMLCDSCTQNAAEDAYERQCEAFHDGGGPLTLDEAHRAAWAEHQEAHKR